MTTTAAPRRAAAPRRPVGDAVAAGLARRATLVWCLALGLFTVAFFWRTLIGGLVLVGFDTLVYFYPNQAYYAERLAAGELPLWNPRIFGGVPFLANIQTAVFYPLSPLVIALGPARGYAVSLALHAGLMAVFTFLLARRAYDLAPIGAGAMALAFAFGGFATALAGHLNQLHAATWLPLLVLLADSAVRTGRVGWALAAGVVLAIQVFAGHVQETYLALFPLGALVLYRAALLARHDPATATRRLAMTAAVAGLVGGGLAAVQALPTLELTGLSIRSGGMTFEEATAFSFPPTHALVGLLPVYTSTNQASSEWRAYVGVIGAVLALLGLVAGRPRGLALVLAALALGGLLLALGQFDPLYRYAHRYVPGIALFRVPARWLFVYSFAAAGLIGLGVDYLARAAAAPATGRSVRPIGLALLGGALGLAPLVAYQLGDPLDPLRLPGATVIATWLALATLATALAAAARRGRPAAPALLVALLAVELFGAARHLEPNHVGPESADSALRPALAHILADGRPGRVLGISRNEFDPGDGAELLAVATRLGVPEARARDYLTAAKHKETLAPNLPMRIGLQTVDGYDGGVLPLKRFVAFKAQFHPRGPELPDGRLSIQLERLPDPDLLSWLNVRFVTMDRGRDLWRDGAYYDLGIRQVVAPDRPLALAHVPAFEATHLDLVLVGEPAPSGAIDVRAAQGSVETLPLPPVGTMVALAPIDGEPARLARVALPRPTRPAAIAVRAGGGPLVARALTLLDARTAQNRPIALATTLRHTMMGDVKVYENTAVLSRAFVVNRIVVADDDEAALARLGPGFRAAEEAVLLAADVGPNERALESPGEGAPSRAEVVSDHPERVAVRVAGERAGLLVLTDAHYPGWEATIDGAPAPIHRANYLFRGVLVPPGEHLVELVYRPASLRLGLLISGATALLTLAGAALALYNSRARAPALEP